MRAADPDATSESLTRRIRGWEAGRSTIRERYRLLPARVLQMDTGTFEERPVAHSNTVRVRAVTSDVIALDELTGEADLLPMAVRTTRSVSAPRPLQGRTRAGPRRADQEPVPRTVGTSPRA
ncbi:hypothetical protein FHS13_004231 [Nocardiopsis algeriensis]|uniref:Uncharacterized protein n=1 Tax=Nocardiopsis algeriensis TaxID=1478215 RepID=A0A841IVP3_9ACTN|nr:hypothetical protein [Nocardiopsis algeriensis]